MTNQQPSVFDFTDYRAFLREAYTWRHEARRDFSHRFVAMQVGATSAGWFSNIIGGRISLTGRYLLKLTKLFGLSSRQTEYFEQLVHYDQAASHDEKSACLARLLSFREVKASVVRREQFDFYTHWYIPTIRELLFVIDFSDDYTALARRLNPAIRPQEARRAIHTLSTLGFIKQSSSGCWKPSEPIVVKDAGFKSVHWANLMRSKINLGLEAVERFSKEERDISEVYIPLSAKGFDRTREEIAALRKKLLVISEQDHERTVVYQFNFQAFPLTR